MLYQILKLGNGKLKAEFGEDIIEIPNQCIVEGDLIEELYSADMNDEDIK